MTEFLSPAQALAIVDNCPFALLVLDKQDCVISYNHGFEQLVGRARAMNLHGKCLPALREHPLQALLRNEKSVCWTDPEDIKHHFEVHNFELDGETRARLFIGIDRQVQLEQAHARLDLELKQQVMTDSVTGLLNQRGMMLALEPQVARSRRYNSTISVLMMEVHGEQQHNRLLQQVARLLKDQLRWADLIGCNERHEFILVLPETAPDAALRLADKLRQRLLALGEEMPGGEHINTCYGVTDWRRNDNATSLLKRAGMALSQARSEQGEHAIAL
ncbi:MAG TPA: GGDEF domain-containing protein [Gammaproteobacteria bacterium]|nr:GGDEF domain-containing protein [Gammaproteobacteria bacterium]